MERKRINDLDVLKFQNISCLRLINRAVAGSFNKLEFQNISCLRLIVLLLVPIHPTQ